jgi:hypothetical protein
LRAHDSRVATRDTRPLKPPPKAADARYLTPEHKAWAKAVIRRAGRRCQDPLHKPQSAHQSTRLFADHIVELRDGGAPLDLSNGMARCGSCHTRKTMAERARRLAQTIDPCH